MYLDQGSISDILLLGKWHPDIFVVRHDDLPWTANEERTWHHMKRAKKVKEWRNAGCLLSRQAKVPSMQSADIHFVSMLKRMNRDIGTEFLCSKAFQDGAITDAGVMPDDRPPYVRSITFHSPIKYSKNALAMLIVRVD